MIKKIKMNQVRFEPSHTFVLVVLGAKQLARKQSIEILNGFFIVFRNGKKPNREKNKL